MTPETIINIFAIAAHVVAITAGLAIIAMLLKRTITGNAK